MGGRTTAQRPLTIQRAPGPGTGIDTREGLYGPGSLAWHHNREAALLLGAGPRALLLQVAHPLVAEGVSQHSDVRADPWGRLAGTLRSYLRIVYGTGPAARAEIGRLNRLHAGVRGPVLDAGAASHLGSAYRARDPDLSLWVHATLIDSMLAVTDAWTRPLTRAARAALYAETLPVGRLFGIGDDRLPPDIDAFDAYVVAMLGDTGPVHPTTTARDLADAILRPPLAGVVRGPVADLLGPIGPAARGALGLVPQPLVDALLIPAIGLLPIRTRTEYGLAWGARERAINAWLVAGWRFWRPRMPERLRWFPQAIAADARAASAASGGPRPASSA